MTVGELIERLKEFSPGMLVVVNQRIDDHFIITPDDVKLINLRKIPGCSFQFVEVENNESDLVAVTIA